MHLGEGVSYLPNMLVRLPMADLLGLLFGDRVTGPDVWDLSA